MNSVDCFCQDNPWGRVGRRMNGFAYMRCMARAVVLGLIGLALALQTVRAQQGDDAPTLRYPPVLADQTLHFPADFGAHPDYRTEWWYITGWLKDEAGAERGFQLTFFRVRTLIGEDNPSVFAPRQLILAHAAVADPAHGRLRHAERSARAFPGLAAALTGKTDVDIGGWFLRGGETLLAPYHSRIDAEDFGFDLHFAPQQAPVLNGKAGFSQKAPDPVNASFYYSRPQLAVNGTLQLEGRAFAVSGHAWLDHEWSSEILPAGAAGWDWIGINLHDGGALMGFQMRSTDGGVLWTSGTLTDRQGGSKSLPNGALQFEPTRYWQSSRTGVRYPVEWRLSLDDGRMLSLRALMDDQELDSRRSTGAIYWEGAVRLFEHDSDGAEQEIGQGYLEMTGYADRLQM